MRITRMSNAITAALWLLMAAALMTGSVWLLWLFSVAVNAALKLI